MYKSFLILFICLSASAIEVFDERGEYSAEYRSIDFGAEEIPEDGKLTLDNGKEYLFVDFLGAGNTSNMIWVEDEQTNEEYALRLGKKEDRYIRFTNMIYPILEEYEVPIPKRYSSADKKYILQEIIDLTFDLDHFFDNYNKEEKIPTLTRDEAAVALMEFAKKTAMFSSISDFNNTQMVYVPDRQEWILLDWTNLAELFGSIHSPHLFNRLDIFVEADFHTIPKEAKELLDDLEQIIYEERERLLEIDKKNFKRLSKFKSKEDFKKLLYNKWYSKEYKANIVRQKYLVEDQMSYVHYGFTTQEMSELLERFPLTTNEVDNFFSQHLEVSRSAEEFLAVLIESDYLFSYTKTEALKKHLDRFIELKPTKEQVNKLIDEFGSSLSPKSINKLEELYPNSYNCYDSIRGFRK